MLQDFEKEIANLFGTEYAIITGSGRSALQIALESFGYSDGNIITPNLSCSIIPQTIISTGLTPYFADINNDLSINLDELENNIDYNTKALLLCYLYGCPTDDIKKLIDYTKDKNIFLIEDIAQAFGAKINGKYAGSFGDCGILSFAKIFFPLFRGGAIITNDKKLANTAFSIRKKNQTNPNFLYNFRYTYKKSVTHLPKSLKKRFTPLNKTALDPNNLYQYHEESSSYHFQDLKKYEITKGIHTLHHLGQLMASRKKIVKGLYEILSKNTNLGLKPLFPYQEDYVYTKIPVFVKKSNLHKWISYFYSKGEFIDMTYRPLSNNTLIQNKCMLSKKYTTSEYISTILLPLPVNNNILRTLKDDSIN
jgi:dTDP-4-amino-4,6-dideoxygalactose transaminase